MYQEIVVIEPYRLYYTKKYRTDYDKLGKALLAQSATVKGSRHSQLYSAGSRTSKVHAEGRGSPTGK